VNDRRRWRMFPTLAVAGFLLLQVSSALAGGVVVTIIDGRKAKAEITLPNPGGGDYTAEFELEFETEGLQNLTPECIGISADVLTPAEITDIQNNRLPHSGGSQQIIDPLFPVRVTVEPPVSCGLAFQNGYDVEIDTENLVFEPMSMYRLVKAPIGGDFKYITGAVTAGSVRVRGGGGGFSEFVVIKDQNPQYSPDCETEYGDLESRLTHTQMSPAARRALETDLARSRAAYTAGNFADAIAMLSQFDAHCVEFGGAGLPNRWRSTRDLDNAEGDMVGHTDNLRFMMGRLSGAP
jgi:uncharacterized protein DUF6689